MMKTQLPENVEKYSETPIFTEKTVPKKVTENHDTKAGVWGKLCVLDGAVDYIIPGPPKQERRVFAGKFAVIEPTIIHRAKPIGEARFKVEFYRKIK
ncbi:DUF1971 domain-containing protein [Kordiimonas sp. SCSIO 12610]|uniref:DUF1971 domain-containing protein n=1 Tax=Kordiimonas sp. SCSIO 12610 TaxID=2829597 RepID=UPI00210B39D8|nr:DUF1971 domain-containing protein [Kordiimonas sp. SCSIO 12610]UTW56077.1 DUF1971 domain-containing protein [Kordiimonas sp. SCSIO 12610]